MKKRWIAILLAAMMVTVASSCGSEPAESSSNADGEATPPASQEEQIESTPEEHTGPIDFTCEKGNLKYVKHELSTDYEGKPVILIYFDFTNNDDEATTAQFVFDNTVFQNGIQCEFAVLTDSNEAYQNLSKEIQKGTTLQVAYPYVLQDTENPVTLEVEELFSFDGEKQTQELALQ